MLTRLLEGLLDLFWPPRTSCLLCSGALGMTPGAPPADPGAPPADPGAPPADLVCPACLHAMAFPPALPRCDHCSRPLEEPVGRCGECTQGAPFGRVHALGLHAGPLREAVHHLKFNGRTALAPLLGQRLAQAVPPGYHALVPVPLHRRRLHQRGYNQAALIAAELGAHLGLPVLEKGLLRLRDTGHQARLDRAGRLANLTGAFGLAPEWTARPAPWAGKAILLVDDVLTTGVTALSVRSLLLASGAASVDVAVLAVSASPVIARRKTTH